MLMKQCAPAWATSIATIKTTKKAAGQPAAFSIHSAYNDNIDNRFFCQKYPGKFPLS